MKKYPAVAVVVLFVGIAIAPSINANVSKEALVEFTTEVCGLNGGKQTVKLTQEEAVEVEALFDSIREKLDTTKSRDEAEEIFKEAVIELDKYDLLGGLSVKQAQKLVTGKYQDSKIIKILESINIKNRGIFDIKSNFLCLTLGMTDWPGVSFQGPLARNSYKLFILFLALSYISYVILGYPNLSLIMQFFGSIILIWIYFPCHLFGELTNPVPIGYTIGIGAPSIYWEGFIPAEGKILTIGLTGKREWNGEFYGCLPLFPNMFYILLLFLPGITGFTGIKFTNFDTDKTFFLGFSLWARIDEEPPDFPWYR